MNTHTIRLGFDRPPMTANESRGAHWAVVRKAKSEVEAEVWARAKAARLAVSPPVEVELTWYAPNARIKDSDSLSVCLKGCLDALVRARVIPGDDHRYVRRSGCSVVVDRADPRIELQINECEQPEDAT